LTHWIFEFSDSPAARRPVVPPPQVYRLDDFTRALQITPGQYYWVSGKVNSPAGRPVV
jgi:hypothetical protein